MAILEELANTADRFEKWEQVQSVVRDPAVERRMDHARVNFKGSRFLDLDDQVFFEQIVEGNDLLPIRYFEMGQLASRPVGRIRLDLAPAGDGYATGFLVAPGVMLTNWHVLKDENFALAATVSFDAEDDIRGLPKASTVFRLDPQKLFYSDSELDFAFVSVAPMSADGRASIERYGYLRLFPQTGKIARDEYATVIQHPHGRQKQVAARNNKVLVYVYDAESDVPDNNYLYYASDTMQGSSGAPVLNDQFFVVALHRRGVPETKAVDGVRRVVRKDGTLAKPGDPTTMFNYVANEGVRVSKILQHLESAAGQSKAAKQVRDVVLSFVGEQNQGPFWVPAAPPTMSATPIDAYEPLLEIIRRPPAKFVGAQGYRSRFLKGFELPLPEPSATLRAKLASRIDGEEEYVLPFQHFSTAVHAVRRMPVFAAVNIDGAKKAALGPMPRRPSWSYDPRISEDHQLDDTIFSQMLQRGHMAARDFVFWGDDAGDADIHSFTLTNVCPQIGRFNGNREWARLERNIVEFATSGRRCVTVFAGPVFGKADPLYDDLRGDGSDATVGTGIRLPNRFWYIACWVQAKKLKHKAFLLDQSDDIEEAGPLEVDLPTPNLVTETTVGAISKLTGLAFVGLT